MIPTEETEELPDEKKLSKILEFSVQGKKLPPGSRRIMVMVITPKMEGHLVIQGLKFSFLKTEHTHNLFKQNSFSYLTFKVKKPTGFLEVRLEKFKPEMVFGEVQRSNLVLNNTKNLPIDDLIIHCEEPLFTGWKMKRFGRNADSKQAEDKERYDNLVKGYAPMKSKTNDDESEITILEQEPAINARERYEIALDLRATMIQIRNLCFTLYYKTEGKWRIKCFFVEMDIQSSFRIKCMTECLEPDKRLICIDFLYKCGPLINWEEIFIDRIYLLSHYWKLVKGSEILTKREGIFMVYLTVERNFEVEDEEQKLPRKQRKVWLSEHNTVDVSENFNLERLESLSRFLKQENLELRSEASKNELCRDYIDLAILWNMKNVDPEQGEVNEMKASGLHSVTSVSMKSISSLSKQEKKEESVSRVKVYLDSEKNISHNFSEGICQKEVKVIVDCSNVKSDVQSISFRALEPYETSGGDGNVYVNMENEKELFNWHSKHERVIKRPFHEKHEVILDVIYPGKGVYDLNHFYFKNVDSGKTVESICKRGEFLVCVEEGFV